MAEEKKATSEADAGSSGRLHRSTSDRWIAGVCGGLAEHYGWDVNVVRIVWAATLLFGGFGVLAYIVAWIIVPQDDRPVDAQTRQRSKSNASLFWGVVLIVIGGIILINQGHWFNFYPFMHHWGWDWYPRWLFNFRTDWLLPLILILLGVYYLATVKKRDSEEQITSASSASEGEKQMEKKLTRSVKDRMIGGVCGGLAEYFNIDPSFVRIGFVLLTLAGGGLAGIVVYVAMMIIVPEETGSMTGATETKSASKKTQPAKTSGTKAKSKGQSDSGEPKKGQ